jgi:hypothetical protein
MVLPLAGGPAKKLFEIPNETIFWFEVSRDGKQIAYTSGTQASDLILLSNF